jgi:hypothetical protein
MLISSFDQETRVNTLSELREALSLREGPVGCFWLGDEWPRLVILVKGEDASVHWFAEVEHPGFYAVGPNPDWDGVVEFVVDNRETSELPIAMVIPWHEALVAAEEFFRTGQKAASLRWEAV